MAQTIFAQATPPGRSGVAVIRISGPNAHDAARALGAGDPPLRQATLFFANQLPAALYRIRWLSLVITVLFVGVATFYFHNFWDMTGADRINNMIHALKNLSLIGGLLLIAGYPRQITVESERYTGI